MSFSIVNLVSLYLLRKHKSKSSTNLNHEEGKQEEATMISTMVISSNNKVLWFLVRV